MAFDEGVADRVRELIGGRDGFAEKRMFGGIAFLLHGNMSCGVIETDLIVRLGEEAAAEALSDPHVREFDLTGRAMKGWAMVDAATLSGDEELARWVDEAADFAASLPERAR